MSELSQLIDTHGALISKLETDFDLINPDNQWPYEQIYQVDTDAAPIITEAIATTNTVRAANRQLDSIQGQSDPELYTRQWHERVFDTFIRIPQSALRNQGLVARLIRQESEAMKELINIAACELLDHAVTSDNRYLGFDGEALGSNTHKTLGTNDSYDNLETAAISETSVKQNWDQLGLLPNQAGIKQGLKLDTLIIPGEQSSLAKTWQDSRQVPGSTNNDANLLFGVEIIEVPSLNNGKRWFATNRRAMKRNMQFYYHEPYRIQTDGIQYQGKDITIPQRVVVSWNFLDSNWLIVNDVP